MTTDSPSAPAAPDERPPTLGARIWRVTARVLLAGLVGIGLGAVAYYGVPAVYRQYVEPVRVNTERLTELEQSVLQSQSAARRQADEASTRLTEIEASLAAQTESIAELRADVDALQGSVRQQDRRLEAADSLAERVDGLQTGLEALGAEVDALQGEDAPIQRLTRRLQMVRAMDLLIRARLWLSQSNLGLAQDELEAAQEILTELAAQAPADEALALASVNSRLDQALTGLSRSPVVAADDLEVAWELLLAASAP